MLGKANEIETKQIFIMAMIKDGGYEKIIVPVEWIGKLAESIKNKGYETATLSSGKTFDVVGFVVTGSMTGERIIVSGSEAQSHEK
ncbi:hypothetical protein D3C76_222110 [compost metagenome]